MRKIRLILLILIGIGILIGLAFFLIGFLKPKIAGLFIETNPPATVFINGEEVGRTPYRVKKDQGEVIIKLIPDSFQKPLVPYETKINLVTGVETVIRREFAETEELSSGEIISFEKIADNETAMVVVSNPDSVEVRIDGNPKAFTPHKTNSIGPGEHKLVLSAEGYLEKSLEVKTHSGYQLTAVVQLMKSSEIQPEEVKVTPTPQEEKVVKEMVQILSTPTGFLRVRAEPSTLGREVGQVEPNESYVLLETDEKTGWFKIEFEEKGEGSQTGWISNQYAKKVGVSGSPTPSVKPTTTPKTSPTISVRPT